MNDVFSSSFLTVLLCPKHVMFPGPWKLSLSYWPIIYEQFILLADHRQTVYLIGRSYTNCLSYWPTTYKQFILFADHIQTVYLIGRSYINSLSYWPIICKQLTRLWLASLFTASHSITFPSVQNG